MVRCPICNRELEITVEDDEGNIRNDPDYEDDPYSGLWYGIVHPDYCNGCVLTDTHYSYGYSTREEAEKQMHRFITLTASYRIAHEKTFDEMVKFITDFEKM